MLIGDKAPPPVVDEEIAEEMALDEYIQKHWVLMTSPSPLGGAALRDVVIVLQRDHERIKTLEARVAALEQQVGRSPSP
jgi:hypothetical protein